MPFSFPVTKGFDDQPYEGRNVPFLEWGTQRLEQAMTQTAGRRLWDFTYETFFDNSELLHPKEANRLYGLPDAGLTFDEPVSVETAKGRRERKERELLMQSNMAAAQHGDFGLKAWGTLPFAIAGQLTDPLELAINAIPFVGIGSRAARLARLAGGTVSPLAERGVLTSIERLAASGVRFPTLTGRLIEATAGNVIAEIPVAVQNLRDQADYELSDSLQNIGIGGLFTAGTHALSRALSRTRDIVSKSGEAARVKAMNTGISQVMRGEGIDVGREFAMDKNVHLEQMRFDETASVRAALESPEVRDAIKFEAIRAASSAVSKLEAGDIGGAINAIRELPITRDVIDAKVDLSGSLASLRQAVEKLPDIGRVELDGRTLNQWIQSIETGKSVEPTHFQKRSEAQLREIANMKRVPEEIRRAAFEAAETRRLNQDFAPGSPAAHSYREKINNYVESKRADFDSELRAKQKAEAAKREILQRQQSLNEEGVRKLKELDPAGESIKADADTAAKDLEADMGRMDEEIDRIESENPELAAAMRKEADFLREEIAKANDIKPIDHSAIRTAVECILNSTE